MSPATVEKKERKTQKTEKKKTRTMWRGKYLCVFVDG